MNRKKYKIILLLLLVVVIVNTSFILSNTYDFDKPQNKNNDNQYNITKVGENVNGTVYKIIAGNLSSNDTVGLILGVHPREHEIHDAINKTIYNITNDNGTNDISKKFVIYFIKVKDNITSRNDTRSAGENLANQFVVDVHEIDEYYEYSNFIFSLSNNTDSKEYANNLSKALNIEYYDFAEGTSPEKVTEPIAEQNINTLLFESSIKNSLNEKDKIAVKLIRACDRLNVS